MIPLEPGDLVIQLTAGGGGAGPASARDPELVADDVRLGYVSPEAAERDYRVAIGEDGAVDRQRTARLRR
jgi:N-methylhydantoinase B